MSLGSSLCCGSPARHCGQLPGEVLVGGGQTSGGVDRRVGRLGQSQQGDVVTALSGVVEVSMKDDQIDVEILRDPSLFCRIQLVLSQPDFQCILSIYIALSTQLINGLY